jgi:hypothetical protein
MRSLRRVHRGDLEPGRPVEALKILLLAAVETTGGSGLK